MSRVPRFEVMMITVFLKSTVWPCASVRCPSSRIWSSVLNTSGWAFSISSNRTTENGFRRTASVSCPPSSYPTYPGGEPISRETVCFSMYSDMSSWISASSSPNRNSARAFESSVFPTPEGPRKMKEPEGRRGSFRPLRVLRVDRGFLAEPDLGDLLVHFADVGWRRHPADPGAGAGLVDQVDRLVRQRPVGDVAVGEI